MLKIILMVIIFGNKYNSNTNELYLKNKYYWTELIQLSSIIIQINNSIIIQLILKSLSINSKIDVTFPMNKNINNSNYAINISLSISGFFYLFILSNFTTHVLV